MMEMDENSIANAMRAHRKREAAFLADPGTPEEIRDAVEGHKNGSIDRAGLVAILEGTSESNTDLFAAIKRNLGWAWCDDEVSWLANG